jgi:hypothetical protein
VPSVLGSARFGRFKKIPFSDEIYIIHIVGDELVENKREILKKSNIKLRRGGGG